MVAGWGTEKFGDGNKSTSMLQDIKITVLGDEVCMRHPGISPMFKPLSMECAFAPNKDACQGDSGGPLFTETSFNRYEQIGK